MIMKAEYAILVLAVLIQISKGAYRVTFSTGSEQEAGINTDAMIKLKGTNGQTSQWIRLQRQSSNDLQPGTDTTYTVDDDYGELDSIEVGHSSQTEAWHLRKVTVVDVNTGTSFLYECLCWIEAPNLTRRLQISPNLVWTEWSDYGACSATCGDATRARTRQKCRDTATLSGCASTETQTQQCTLDPCPTRPAGPWTAWSACTVTCGKGTQRRQRTCDASVGCEGDAPTGIQDCDSGKICPTTPSGPWSEWSECTVTCGSGTRNRNKTCDNSLGCEGTAPSETAVCNTQVLCPTIPLGPWSEWSTCSKTCGGPGKQSRFKTCDNPAGCIGDPESEERDCNENVVCPTTPAGPWGAWGSCTVTCGVGTRTRNRTCDNPVGCKGDAKIDTGNCDTNVTCPTTPAGPWSAWSTCSATCGTGTHTRSKTCANPAGCKGEAEKETADCNNGICPTTPAGPWTEWSSCSVTCGNGTRTRSKTCVNPLGCKGDAPTDPGTCSAAVGCKPSGPWGSWGACSVTCGPGAQIRSRTCDDLVNGCTGIAESEKRSCSLQSCDACSGDQFQCRVDGGQDYCIERSKVCDGTNDCIGTGADESVDAGCDDGGSAVASASFTIPLIIAILILVAIVIIVVIVWCLLKRKKQNRKRKVAPMGSQVSQDSPSSSSPFGSFGNLNKPLILPQKRKTTPKKHYSPDLTRRTVTQRVEAPHIIHLPGDEVIPAGLGTTHRGGNENWKNVRSRIETRDSSSPQVINATLLKYFEEKNESNA